MAGALMNKVWDLFGMDTAEPEEEENIYDYEDEETNEEESNRGLFGKKNKVVAMPQKRIK